MARRAVRVRIREYGRISVRDVGRAPLQRLRTFDEQQVRGGGTPVFDWGRRNEVRARNIVGVIQVPGLCVEILPKIDGDDGNAQANLVYMLNVTRRIPVIDAGMTALDVVNASLLDAFALIFASRLRDQLVRGPDRAYVRLESDLSVVKGQLVIQEQIRRDDARRHILRVRHDEFVDDTLINRVLKAAVLRLRRTVRDRGCLSLFTHILELLADVEIVPISRSDVARVVYHRNNERYRPLFEFACMVLFGSSPSPRARDQESFSILFPMDRVFEEFFARYVSRHAERFGLDRRRVHAQARGRRKWLVRREADDRGVFRLKPDLLIEPHGSHLGAILDTKWKVLLTDEQDKRNGVKESDAYQMHAYAGRYGYPDNVLVFPAVAGATPKRYRIPGTEQALRVATIRLDGDLRRDRSRLDADVLAAVQGGVSES